MSPFLSFVDLVDRVPGPIAAAMSSNSGLARLTRPVFNRMVPAEETVVTVRSGLAKGLRLPVAPRAEKYYWTGTYESHLQDVLASVLGPGMRFWDVGAHIGFFTLIAARLVGDSGSVRSFEPMPANWARLEKTVAVNGLSNVTVCRFALAESVGVRTLHFPTELLSRSEQADRHEGSPMWALVRESPGAGGVRVECRRLDDVAASAASPDVIKIDAEGAEVEVLAGGVNVLESCRPVLVVEMHSEKSLERARALLPSYSFEHLAEDHWLLR